MFVKWEVDKILLTGWAATQGIDSTHSDSAFEYLVRSGIPWKVLHKEQTWSLETVWEFIFARKEHDTDILQVWEYLVHLSSDYHIPRMREIALVVWGWRKNIEFKGIAWFHRDFEAEKKSLEAFHRTFAGVIPWNLDQLLATLWKKHPLYVDHPLNPNSRES